MLDDDDFAILNAIYLKKMATAATVAEITGLPRDRVEQRLAAAAEAGQVIDMGGSGAMLLEDGTTAVLAYYRDTYAAVRAIAEVVAWYEAFEVVNAKFIAQVTAWQHSEGDERAERKLLQTAEKLARDIRALEKHVPRYATYVKRFTDSMDRVDRGQHEFVCNPTIDSVHNIWFEFHEDILAVLGRPRDTT
jgi:predicted Rossmann fold nucleotide-binding protein DprA/Smf involved in DNA uptake